MTEGVGFRDAVMADGPAVAAVFTAARAEMRYVPQLHTPAHTVTYFSEQVVVVSQVTVAVVADEVVGFSAVKDGWLEHLYVVPARQGSGIGAELLSRAMSEHVAGLSLWAFAENERAVAFYLRHGFVEVLRTDGRGNQEQLPDVQMRWSG